MEKRVTYNRGWRMLIALFIVALTATSCAVSAYRPAASYASDDMYAVHSVKQIQQESSVSQQVKEQRMQQWAQELGLESTQATYSTTKASDSSTSSYNTPYGERLLALSGGGSYSTYAAESTLEELAMYDPDQYSATINSEGEITLEPKYSASTYGSWDNDYYGSAWIYGYPTWSYDYMWGYPRYVWSPWSFSYYYSPWYYRYPYYSFYRPYRPYYYSHNYRPPSYNRPSYKPNYKPSNSSNKRTIVTKANPYQSPSSKVTVKTNQSTTKANGSTTVGTTSNSSSYNRSATSRSSSSSSSSSSVSRSSSSSSSISRPSSSSSSSISRPSSSSSSSSSSTNSFGR